MICTTKRHWTKLVQVFVDTDMRIADAERNALRAYLDEKGFKTSISLTIIWLSQLN